MAESRTPLRIFQTRAVESATGVLNACLEQLGRLNHGSVGFESQRLVVINRQGGLLFEAPTGTGKTLMAGTTAEAIAIKHKIIWFWFAPFEGLIAQSAGTIRAEFSNLRVRDLQTDRSLESLEAGDVFLTTWASVAVANASSRKVRAETESMPSVDDLLEQAREAGFKIGAVVDEAHHSFRTDTQAMRFYTDFLRPDLTILVTATPDDADVTSFTAKTGMNVQRISISREQGVGAGLLKTGVKVGVMRLRDEQTAALVDLRQAAIWQGVQQHLSVKKALESAGIDLVPLLLIQVENAGDGSATPEIVRKWIVQAGIPDEKIRVHTAAEPTGELMGIAHDESVEVLIFKMAVALGFDAPRSHTLVSLRSTRDPDFAIQIIGRIMRVHRKVQSALDVPESLGYGFVFLADAANQEGLLSAAKRIKSIKDEIAPLTYAVQVDEYGMAHPSIGNAGPLLVPEQSPEPASGVCEDLQEPVGSFGLSDDKPLGGVVPAPSGVPPISIATTPAPAIPVPVAEPPTPLFPMHSGSASAGGASASQASGPTTMPPKAPTTGFTYPLRNDIAFPNPFLTVEVDPAAHDILVALMNNFAITPDLFEVAQMETQTVLLNLVEVFEGKSDPTTNVQAQADLKLIAQYAQESLFDANKNGLLDVRAVQTALEEKLKRYAIETANKPSFATDPEKVRQGVEKILVLRPSAIRKAFAVALSTHTQLLPAAPLPLAITHHEPLEPSVRNLYRVFPPDLNSWERPFAELLDNDTTGLVQWWHRNQVRKPYSVSLPVPGQMHNFYPDLIAGIQGRRAPGILLIEPKRVINDPEHNAQDKSLVKHPEYGKVLMVIYIKETLTWQTVEYQSSTDKNVVDRALNDFSLFQSYGIGGAF